MSRPHLHLYLASGSKYKKEVLSKLGIPFSCISPDIDESPRKSENAETLVKRLAFTKAQTVAKRIKNTDFENDQQYFVIGVDQVALFNDQLLGKPLTEVNATKQLMSFSGKTVTFLSGICLFKGAEQANTTIERYKVSFKTLTQDQVSAYVKAESPLDCAGSFKCEGMGILLFSAMEGRDINSLVGLPLLALQELFLEFDIDLFNYLIPTSNS